ATRARQAVLLIVTGVVVVGARLVFAQPATEITVDEVVARALADNPDLKAVRADVDAAVGRVRQAGLRPNPMLELGAQKALGPDNNLTVGLSLPLDLNGRKEGRVGLAQAEVVVRRAQLAERERRLRAEIRAKAGDVLAARRNLAPTRALLDTNPRAEAAMAAARVRKEEAEGRWDAKVNVGYQRQDFGFDLRGLTESGATRPIHDVFHYFGAGVSVTLPVLNRNQGNVAATRAESR